MLSRFQYSIEKLNYCIMGGRQWRSEGNWRPGANLNFAPPPPQKKSKKTDIEMSGIN